MLLAVLMLISMMPTSVFAAPASDIPAEMLDNVFLDALEYTGYKVQAQRDDGTIFKKYSGGATAYLSKISYGLNKYGTETVAKSGTATGLAPDIAGFESTLLRFRSFAIRHCFAVPGWVSALARQTTISGCSSEKEICR